MLSAVELASKVEIYHPKADLEVIKAAYAYAQRAHTGQNRKSGDPYFTHPVSVAGIIAELRLDVASVCAALLHDVVEDCPEISEGDLADNFGEEISFLVDGVTKLTKIDFNSRQDRQAESFRKMVVAMARDIRVLVVKLCDRLDNMRTLQFMSADGQERISRETMDIYAPLAARLGMARFKNEFEDLSFRYLNPEGHAEVRKVLDGTETQREQHIQKVCRQLTTKLSRQGFAAKVSGRAKHNHSLWRKMQDRKCALDKVHDLVSFNVIVESVADCYAVLGVIHSLWRPIPGRFKDFVALPKPNRYQSLHTTVMGPSGMRVEIQIRTGEMNQVADFGIAAHWHYKEGRSGGIERKDAEGFEWLRRLMESQTELKDPAEFLESVKGELFPEEVFVFTPKGEVKVFPRGSTPIDFAFSIHTELGNHCAGARVNGSVAALGYKLRNGDLVEVMTQPEQHPYKSWLDWVGTARARNKIRQHLRGVQRTKSGKLGRELLEGALIDQKMSLARLEKDGVLVDGLKDHFGVRNISDLFVNIGYGKVKSAAVVDFLAPPASKILGLAPSKRDAPVSIRQGRLEQFVRRVTGRGSHGILLNGVDDVLVRYTKCCNPLPGDAIVGFMTRGRGVTVHRRECKKAFEADPDRKVDIRWDPDAKINRRVTLKVTTTNRQGILATMGQIFHGLDINISEAMCRANDDGRALNTFIFLCSDLAQLKEVTRHLKKIDGVINVDRG